MPSSQSALARRQGYLCCHRGNTTWGFPEPLLFFFSAFALHFLLLLLLFKDLLVEFGLPEQRWKKGKGGLHGSKAKKEA